MTQPKIQPVAFYGHHKCATTWLRGILAELGQLTQRSMATFDNSSQFQGDLAEYLTEHPLDIIAYTNADIEEVRKLPFIKSVHLIRDPRDIIVSGYFSHMKSHPTEGWPELIDHRNHLIAVSKEDGLHAEIEFSGPTIDLMQTWDYGQKDVLELRYEDVIRDPYTWLLRAGLHWELVDERDLKAQDEIRNLMNRGYAVVRRLSRNRVDLQWSVSKVPEPTFLEIAYKHRFERNSKGSKRGQEDTASHYRKGVAGDWKEHFTPEVNAHFLERFPNLLEKLGYA